MFESQSSLHQRTSSGGIPETQFPTVHNIFQTKGNGPVACNLVPAIKGKTPVTRGGRLPVLSVQSEGPHGVRLEHKDPFASYVSLFVEDSGRGIPCLGPGKAVQRDSPH